MKVTPWLMLLLLFSSALFSCGNKAEQKTETPQWVLQSKKFYSYSLTPTGQVDTTFILNMTYDNFQKKDSSSYFNKNIYENKRVVEVLSYHRNEGQKPEFLGKFTYTYNNKGLPTKISVYKKGVLFKQENYTYDTAGKLIAFRAILPKDMNNDEDKDEVLIHAKSISALAFDTINLRYEYDTTNRVVRSIATDNSGNLIRTDVNVYSGGAPLESYSLGPRGDTLIRTSYQPEGRFIKTVSTNDTLVLTRVVSRTMAPLAQVTELKRTKQMFRRVYNYQQHGLNEQSFYVLK